MLEGSELCQGSLHLLWSSRWRIEEELQFCIVYGLTSSLCVDEVRPTVYRGTRGDIGCQVGWDSRGEFGMGGWGLPPVGLVNMKRYGGWSGRERGRGVGFERSEGCSLIVREVDIVERVL